MKNEANEAGTLEAVEKSTFVRFSHNILEWFSSLSLLFMMLLTFADVIGRYFWNAPIFGATEVLQFLLIGMIFSGMGLVVLYDKHISVDIFSPAIGRRFPRLHAIYTDIFTFVGLGIVGVQLFRIGINDLERNVTTIVLELPRAAIILPVSIFCLLAALLQLWIIINTAVKKVAAP